MWFLRTMYTVLFISLFTIPVFINSYPSIVFSIFLVYLKKENENFNYK
jgi:hypothetical protein